MKKIVVIGGGTGTFTVLQGLKKYPLDITAIVTMADSGGSSGRLRDEFGVLPPGDVRQCLAALVDNGDTEMMRQLFLYRFQKGVGLKGHNFGNLFLTALTDIAGSEVEAIKIASKILNIRGKVVPVSTQKAELCVELEDGFIVKGEHNIDEPKHNGVVRIKRLWLEPSAKVNKDAVKSIQMADVVVLGPGDLYTSVLANVVVEGMAGTLKDKKIIYFSNLISKYGQTYKYNVSDHVDDLERYLNRSVDHIIVNNIPLPEEILERYALEQGYEVVNDMQEDLRIIQADLLTSEIVRKVSGDVLKRSLIRHDSDKLAAEIDKLL